MVQHDQSAELSIDGVAVVYGRCCSSGIGGSISEKPLELEQGTPYHISVGYIQRTGGTFYARAMWKQCESAVDCSAGVFSLIQGSATHGVSSSSFSEPRGGGVFIADAAAANISGLVLMRGNTADGGNGGGIFIDNGGGISRVDGSKTHSRHISGVRLLANVAKNHTIPSAGGILKTIGEGLGGGIFANVAQIGHAKDFMHAAFQSNLPSGIHANRSSMFLARPLAQFADPIVSLGFPFPVPGCPAGTYFPFGDPDPWNDLAVSGSAGPLLCQDCPEGRWTEDGQSAPPSCQRIPKGKFLNAVTRTVDQCPKGHECLVGGIKHECPQGTFSDSLGQEQCFPCLIGTFSNESGSVSCKKCPQGQLQNSTGQDHCTLPSDGTIAIDGTSSMRVPDGWATTSTTKAAPCAAGTYGNTELSEKSFCRLCPAGWTSYRGALRCHPCGKGKHSPESGMDKCIACSSGRYQPQELLASAACTACPAGFDTITTSAADARTTAVATGGVSCQSLGWKSKADCDEEHFLNDTDSDPSVWGCAACVRGASCKGNINASGIRALFGWSMCPASMVKPSADGVPTFEPCLFGAACNGASNPLLFNKFVDSSSQHQNQNQSSVKDPAKQDFATGSCWWNPKR